MTEKKKLGIFKLSSCAGCQMQLLYYQQRELAALTAYDITYFKMGKRDNLENIKIDVAVVEGCVTNSEQIEEIKKIRENTKILATMGGCATRSSLWGLKNKTPEQEIEAKVYKDLSTVHSTKAIPIPEVVKVDYTLPGCPVGEAELTEFLQSALIGKKPYIKPHSVCMECKMKGNLCILVAKDEPCMGPVTDAGCGALCPSYSRPCYNCRGPMAAANALSLAKEFEKNGLSKEEIYLKFTGFSGLSEIYKEVTGND